MVLELRSIHARFVVVCRVLVEIGEQDGLGVGGFDVFARAAVAVAAGADFVVEAAVDFVLFGAEDGGEVVGHVSRWVCGCIVVAVVIVPVMLVALSVLAANEGVPTCKLKMVERAES